MLAEQRASISKVAGAQNGRIRDGRGPQARTSCPAVEDAAAEEGSATQRRRGLHECVSWLIESESACHLGAEKRSHRRFPFRRPFTVTPISNATGRPDQFRSFPAFGIDISPTGICFIAHHLVPARRALLSLEGPGGKLVGVLFEPRWVRFTRGGWYQTGGRLVELLQENRDVMPVIGFTMPPLEVLDSCERSRHT